MLISTASLFLIIFVAIIIAGYFIIHRFEISDVQRFQLIVSYLGGLSAILITYNIYLTIKSNDRIEKNRLSYNTIENISKNFLMPQKELLEQFPEGYFLYASMYQDLDLSSQAPKEFNASKRAMVELYSSVRMFQAMEDFLSTASFDITGNYVWIANFLTWLQSPILQKNWNALSINYAEDTREFVERLIVEANKLSALRAKKGSLTIDDYTMIAKPFRVKAR